MRDEMNYNDITDRKRAEEAAQRSEKEIRDVLETIIENSNEIRLVLDCAGLILMAERELAAFFNAVTDLFGSELAQLSGEDWLKELTAIDALPASAREWRLITARASTRLASRLRLQIGLGAERIAVSNDSLTARRKTFPPQRDQGPDLSPSSQQLSAVPD
jgi:PAS domain-containing protein